MKKIFFLFLIGCLMLNLTSDVLAVDNDTDTVFVDFNEIDKITRQNNQSILSMNKKVEAFRRHDKFDQFQSNIFDSSVELSNAQTALQEALQNDLMELSGNFEDLAQNSVDTGNLEQAQIIGDIGNDIGSLTSDLAKSIGANTAAIKGLLSEIYSFNLSNQYADLLELYANELSDKTVQGAENLYIAYNILSLQLEELYRKQELTEYTLSKAEIKYTVGMMTKAEWMALKTNRQIINTTIESLEVTLDDVLKNLGNMMGYDNDVVLVISDTPVIEEMILDSIDYEKDKDEAYKTNYTRLKNSKKNAIAKANYDEEDENDDVLGSTELMYDSTKLDLEGSKHQFNTDFDYIYQSLMNSRRTLELEKEKYLALEEQLRVAGLQKQVGLISGLDYKVIEDQAYNQILCVNKAESEVFKSYNHYQWAINGLLEHSLESYKQ